MMENKFKLKITQKHIESALPKDFCFCPAACAFIEQYPNCVLFGVGEETISFIDEDGVHHLCALPEELQTFIKKFDNNEKVSESTFEIELNESLMEF